MSIIIRKALEHDAAEITRIIQDAYAIYQGKIEDLPDVSSGVTQEIEHGGVWVAEYGSVVAGVMFLKPQDTFMLLANIASDPDFKGKGIGKALMAHAENLCADHKMHEMRLATHKDMQDNIAYYQHLGWTITSQKGVKVFMSKML